MRLTLPSRSYDLTTHALVLGTVAGAAGQGADLVEVAGDEPAAPVCARAVDLASLGRALDAGAELIVVAHPASGDVYRACAAAGVAVVAPDPDTAVAAGAGLPPGRLLPASVLLDVTARPCPLGATVAGVLRGARIVRTDDVRAARRVCDVLAATLDAGAR